MPLRQTVLLATLTGIAGLSVPPKAPALEMQPGQTERGATVTVIVTGAVGAKGLVGAALYDAPNDFLEAPATRQANRPRAATAQADTFVFRGVPSGRYALAVQHDINANGTVDRNLFGMPKEPWGVSRNIRHSLRAPSFDEAAFTVVNDTIITVRVAK